MASRVATLVRSWSRPRDQATELFGVRDAALFVALWAYYLLYPHQGFEGLIPDNIAQTAYWSLLTRPELVGSIGSSTPKAGLIVLLGATHYLSYDLLGSAWAFKAILSLFIAGTLTLIGRIAEGVRRAHRRTARCADSGLDLPVP